MAETLESIQKSLAEMISKRCKLTAQEVETKYFDGTDHWITAAEAQTLGLIDGTFETDGGENLHTTEEIYNHFINQFRADGTDKNKNSMALLDSIKKIAGFEDKDEAGILSQITTLNNQATKVDALQKANDALKAKVIDLENKEIDTFLNQAVKDGKIAEEQKDQYKTLMAADRTTVEALINGMTAKPAKPAQPTRRAADVFNQGGGNGLEAKSWDELDKADKLTELKATNRAVFEAKFKEKFGVDYVD
jgi:hypothetical protein